MVRPDLENFQKIAKVLLPLFILISIPLTLWVAITFRENKAGASSKADFNTDGRVDFQDLQTLTDNYLTKNMNFDLDKDGRVDAVDFSLFSNSFSRSK